MYGNIMVDVHHWLWDREGMPKSSEFMEEFLEEIEGIMASFENRQESDGFQENSLVGDEIFVERLSKEDLDKK